MYSQFGNCPQCGAPIYVPAVWHSVLPPEPVYTCGCRLKHQGPTFWRSPFYPPVSPTRTDDPPWPGREVIVTCEAA